MLRAVVALTFALALTACGGAGGGHRDSSPAATDAAPPPPIGAPEPVITAYLDGLRADAAHAKQKLRQAQRQDDEEEVARRKELLRDAERFYRAERDRLTPRDTPMIGGGIALVSIGGLAMISSFALGFSASFQGSESQGGKTLRAAAIGTLCGGAALVGAGIPLIVYGAQRQPRPPDESAPGPETVRSGGAADPGATLIWTY